jgi:DNA repair exonuclease SbcCD ATPase subunit
MKYAIYDKAADGYLTSMEFDTEVPDTEVTFSCGYNEYITEAKLLDTPKEATDAIVRIGRLKFVDKGRFVMHSFDDTFKDQYIISEAGTPTKVVDNITVDLDGNINVKYGTMVSHWSATSIEYAVNRMNALQKAKSPKYTAWCNTFDIYKVIKAIDEKGFVNYQFIKVTEKGLAEYAKEEVDPLNKRIKELEKTNYEFGKRLSSRSTLVTNLRVENTNLKNKVESIKKEARDWKTLYENAKRDREVLTKVIDNIYDDLHSDDMYKDLKDTYDYVHNLYELHNIKIHNDDDDAGMPIYITANVEFRCIIDKIMTIIESLELNQRVAFDSADEVHNARNVAYDIISICEEDSKFEITLKKFSQLHEAMNTAYNTDDDPIMHAFNSVLLIFEAVERNLEKYADEIVTWKNKAQKTEKALNDQKKLNETFNTTIVRYRNEMRDMDKKVSNAADWLEEVNDKNEKLTNMLKEITDCVSDIMLATRTVDNDKMLSNLTDVSLKLGVKTIDDGPIYSISIILNILIRKIKEATEWKARTEEAICKCKTKDADYETLKNKLEACEVILDSTHDLKNSESVYGITIPSRCNGKQAFCDIATGKKILIDKKKYDELVEWIDAINTTYDTMFFMNKPAYLHIMIEHLNDLTK